jgi:hypothetical protein
MSAFVEEDGEHVHIAGTQEEVKEAFAERPELLAPLSATMAASVLQTVDRALGAAGVFPDEHPVHETVQALKKATDAFVLALAPPEQRTLTEAFLKGQISSEEAERMAMAIQGGRMN